MCVLRRGIEARLTRKVTTRHKRSPWSYLESSEYKEALGRMIAEVQHHSATNSRSNGEGPSIVSEQEANDDGDENVGKWGPTFCFT